MGIFSSHPTVCRYALLEVESGSVAALVYEYEGEVKIPKLLLEKRIHIDVREGFALTAIIDELPKALRKLTDSLAIFGRFQRIDVSVGAPWAYVAHIQAKKTADKPFVISYKMQDELIHEATDIDTTLAKTIFDLIGPYAKDLTIQSVSIEGASINGYPVSRFIGRKATAFEALITQRVTIAEVGKKIEEATDSLSIERTHITDSISSFSAFPREKEATLVIDVGSYTTELSYVRTNRIERYAILPYGIETVIRGFAAFKGISRAEADSRLIVLAEHLVSGASTDVLKEISDFTSMWLRDVRDYVSICAKEMQIIDAILLVTEAHEKIFLALLKEDSYIKTKDRKYYGLEQDKITFAFSNGVVRDTRLAALSVLFCTKK